MLSVSNKCKLSCCKSFTYCLRAATKERHKSAVVRQCQSLKYVNNVSCVDQLCSVKLALNVPDVAQNLPVGARLNQFGKLGKPWGARPKVVQLLKEGHTLPFQARPNLTYQQSAAMYIPTGTFNWWRHCNS